MEVLLLVIFSTQILLIISLVIFIAVRQTKSNKSQWHLNQLSNQLSQLTQQLNQGVIQQFAELTISQNARLDRFSLQVNDLVISTNQKADQLQQQLQYNLEKIRSSVDERLQASLEKRLGESFQLVSSQLEQVYKGLGEMKQLAAGVSDLKKVMSNVKTRGIWGEIQLERLLEQMLTPQQFQKNVQPRPHSSNIVEFAIKFPGTVKGQSIWLPLDAKFPQELYSQLQEAHDSADKAKVDSLSRQLETRIKQSAKEIQEKYIEPPYTTDFAILFLPLEGLFSEITKRPDLLELVQRDFRIVIAGPTTLMALLNSLQIGFRSLAIEKRSSEIWQIIAKMKVEFSSFGSLLDKTHKKLVEATDSIELASRKSRQIQHKLDKTQELDSITDKA